jgi:hypothetical protein
MKELKKRWKIESNFQLVIIFIVFAITGSTSAWLSKPVCFGWNYERRLDWYTSSAVYNFSFISSTFGLDWIHFWAI